MIVHPVTFEKYDTLPPAMPIRVLILDWIMDTFLDPSRHKRVVDLGCGAMNLSVRY